MEKQDSLQSLFDKAQKQLESKDFQGAKENLKKIQETGYTSASVEASLARSFFETGEEGRALTAWQKAVALDRFNSSYRSDLALAESKIAANAGTRLEHPAEFANTLASYVRPSEFFYAGALIFLVFIWIGISGVLQKTSRALVISISLLVFLIFSAGIFGLTSRSLAVVTNKTALKPAPLESAEGSLELIPGTRVRILKTSGDFVEIERPNSFRGWVGRNSIETSPF